MRDKLLYILILLALLSSIVIGFQRYQAESLYNKVDLTVDLDDLMDATGGIPVQESLKKLKQEGIHSVAVKEITLQKAQTRGMVGIYTPAELKFMLGKVNADMKQLSNLSHATIVIPEEEYFFDLLYTQLSTRFKEGSVETKSVDGLNIIIVKHPKSYELMNMELGFDFKQFDMIKNLGLKIIPRIKNHPNLDEKYINRLFQKLKEYHVSAIVFEGDEVLGYPEEERLEMVSHYIKEYPFGLIETVTGPTPNFQQKGMEKVAKLSGYNLTRVFSLSENEMKQLPPKDILGKWSRSVERNNRIIYIKPIFRSQLLPEENLQLTLDNVKKLKDELTQRGFEVGDVETIPYTTAGKLLRLLITAGATAAGVIMLDLLYPPFKKYRIAVFLVFFIPLAGLLFTSRWIMDVILVSLAVSIIFPSIALLWLNRELYKKHERSEPIKFKQGVGLFFKVIGINFIGALLLAALLSDIRFFMKLELFRGVKIAFVLPIGIVWLGYMAYWGKTSVEEKGTALFENLLGFLEANIRVKHIVFMGLGGIIFLVYLLRSGNLPGFNVPGFEQQMRVFLENLLLVRPRTKEFLVGYPSLMLLIWSAAKKHKFLILPFNLLSGIGLISMINTFSHLHIAISISLLRTLYGIILGIALGFLGLAVVAVIMGYAEKIQEVLINE